MPSVKFAQFAFESDDGEFVMMGDGSWEAHQDGVVVHGSAFTRTDLAALSEEADRIRLTKIGLYENDRTGDQ